jgi:hypothetical protein
VKPVAEYASYASQVRIPSREDVVIPCSMSYLKTKDSHERLQTFLFESTYKIIT